MKTKETKILEEIAQDLPHFLKMGDYFNFNSITQELNLNIENIRELLKIHFVLTEKEKSPDQKSPGVIDFVRELRTRLRRLKTSAKKDRQTFQGKVLGRINWKHTIKKRYQTNPKDRTLFVCERRERNYEIQENLVLKRLLQIIYNIVESNLKRFMDKNTSYEWLSDWVKKEQHTNLRTIIKNVFLRNIYLRRIDLKDKIITPRMINRAKSSRNELYREAGYLLERYRKLMRYDLNPDEAKELLRNTFIKPAKTEVLFELYWVLSIFKQYYDTENPENFQGKLFIIESGKEREQNLIAKWSLGEKYYKLYHDSTGNLRFLEKIDEINEVEIKNEFLKREVKVLKTLKEMVKSQREKSLWGGRPDILLEICRKKEGEQSLEAVFIGEVKYTDRRNYAIEGLRELLEYIAFIRDERKKNSALKETQSEKKEGNYIEKKEEELFSNLTTIQGGLFIDEIENLNIDTETLSNGKIKVYQFPNDEDIIIE